MPRRREGPVLNPQTGHYFFDQIIGFKPNKQRICVSLGTKDPKKACFLWEQEYRRRWAEYYGLESPAKPAPVSFKKLAREFVDFERDFKRVKEWKTQEDRLDIIYSLWGTSAWARSHVTGSPCSIPGSAGTGGPIIR